MTSFKQIEANRRNALKSTGPTTLEGKQRSRCNAVRHGLTSETVIATLEDAGDYQAFEAAVIADYEADSAVERELVLRLASALWRLRRATGIETALFEATQSEPGESESDYSGPTLVGADLSGENQSRRDATRPFDTITASSHEFDAQSNVANRFLRLIAFPTFPLDRLNRYEYLLWRQARQLVSTLETLRRRSRPPKHTRFSFSLRR